MEKGEKKKRTHRLVFLGEKPRVSDGHAIRPAGVKERDEKDRLE